MFMFLMLEVISTKVYTNGTFVKEWNIQRTKATELVPPDIATDNAGNVYVLDGGSNRYKSLLLMVLC